MQKDGSLPHSLCAGTLEASGNTLATDQRARWVANERWPPKQESRVLKDGSYELYVAFSDDCELIMDILKYGADCEVVSPKALREKVAAELARAGMRYQT